MAPGLMASDLREMRLAYRLLLWQAFVHACGVPLRLIWKRLPLFAARNVWNIRVQMQQHEIAVIADMRGHLEDAKARRKASMEDIEAAERAISEAERDLSMVFGTEQD